MTAFGLTACATTKVSPKPPACPEWTPEEYWAMRLLIAISKDHPEMSTTALFPELRPVVDHVKRQKRHCDAIEKMR